MKTNCHRIGWKAILLLVLNWQALTAQHIRRVPADFGNIQAAVDAAQDGDTVLVSPGLYYENIQLRGRNIVLSSRYFLEANPAEVIRQTIIDGSKPLHPDTASCLLIWKGESPATVIQGFSIQGGKGTVWLDPAGAGVFREGGGILTEGSSPIIRHNIIHNNNVLPATAGQMSSGGGGIRCGEGSVRIENNQIIHNSAAGYGGGIVFNYCPNAVVANNVIAFNFGGKDYSGGGFWATGQDGNTLNTLINNTIAYNSTPPAAGQYGGKGGGVWAFSITLKMENNIVWGNTQAIGKPIGFLGAALQMNANCVETGFSGAGTISDNPVFRDTSSFVLEAGSPAIDAGTDNPDTRDFSYNGRRAAFPARGRLRSDLGAYGGSEVANPACPASFLAPALFSKVLQSPVVGTPGDSRSVNWVDIDNDKDLDLFISNGPEQGENNMLYRNNGSGGFSAVSDQAIVQDGSPSDGSTWADFDNDGDIDCFVVNWYGANNLFYKNDGTGHFEKITTGAFVTDGGYSETASWGDYDKDGFVDLYVANSGGNKKNFLYHNNGDGTLSRVLSGAPVTDASTTRSVNWTDFDLDGDLDLFVTNENNENEQLYRNDGGTFAKITGSPLVGAGGATMSSSWGDFDNDGDLDVFLANDQGNDGLYRNNSGSFEKIGADPVVISGGNSFGSQWADVDNDGDLDLFVTNSFWGGLWKNFLFINQGNGSFLRNETDIAARDQGWSYGCAFGDIDRDGDLDLAVATCFNANQTDYLYENHSAENANHWLDVQLEGVTGNRSAIGAKAWIHFSLNGQKHVQLQEVSAQSGYCGQNQLNLHFGMGAATSADSLVLQWPSGQKQTFKQLTADQFLVLREGQAETGASEPASAVDPILSASPNPFSDTISFSWEMPATGSAQLQVLDLQGKIIYSRKGKSLSGKQEWNWNGRDNHGSRVASGMYIVQLSGKNWQCNRRIVRE